MQVRRRPYCATQVPFCQIEGGNLDVRHPAEMGAAKVEAFLTHLAVKENVAAL
jgi:hypothetical protein